MIELLGLLLAALIDALRSRERLLLENLLLLRQQLQVALRYRRRPRLGTRDKLFWLLVRRVLTGSLQAAREYSLIRPWSRCLRTIRPPSGVGWGSGGRRPRARCGRARL